MSNNLALADLSDQDRALLQELMRYERALDSLGGFRQFMESTGHNDFAYPHEKHHAVVAEHLERVVSGEINRLMVCLPPGAAKSTIVSIQFATWWWAMNPGHHILRCSATQSLAEKFARRCRAAIMTDEYKRLTGTEIDKSHQSVSSFGNMAGGTMTAAGVGTSIVGLRSNLSILDDPVSSFEAVHSETQRQAALDWYRTEYRSRLIPGSPEIIVTTRWHTDDIPGAILKSEEAGTWTVVRIPMVCDSDDDPIGRKVGERLWPQWFTDRMVEEAQRDPERWAGMYQQVPLTSEGDWLNPDDIEVVDEAPSHLNLSAGLDIAMTDGRGDFSVCVVAGMDAKGTMWLVDMWRDRVTPDSIVNNLVHLHGRHNLREVLLDNDVGAKVFKNLAHKILMERRQYLPLVDMPMRGQDKEVRAAAFRGLAKMGGVKMVRGPWNTDLLREISEFPFGDHDDIVDALGLLGRRAAAMGKAGPTLAPQGSEIEAAFIEEDGRMYTRASLDDMWEQPVRKGTLRI